MSPKSSKLLSLTCPLCGKEFKRYPSQIKEGAITYCSGACYHAARRDNALPTQWRENISKATRGKPKPPGYAEKKRGVPLSEEHRAAISRGNKAYRARVRVGGIKPKSTARLTREYRRWRWECLERDAFTCQDCGRVFAPGQRGIHVHHLRPFASNPDVRLAPGNGVSLCTSCHRVHHSIVQLEDYERMEQVPCACGCGEMMYPITAGGQPRRYLRYHNMRGKPKSAETRAKISASLTGRKLAPFTDEHRRHMSEGRKGKGLGRPSPFKGWHNTYMTQDEFIAAYPRMTSLEIARHCHVSPASVTHWAKALSLPPRYGTGGTGLLRPRSALRAGEWGPGRECCVDCGTTQVAHKGRQLCVSCYSRRRTLARNPDAEQRSKRRKATD